MDSKYAILTLYDCEILFNARTSMINEERVKHMTMMAIFEKELGPEYQPMLKYSKKDTSWAVSSRI